MTTIQDVVRAARSAGARDLSRGLARTPVELEATRLLESLPTMELVDITGPLSFEAKLTASSSRHAWSVGAAEQLILQALMAAKRVRSAFEIGTFNGGTTRLIAEALPEDGRVVTMDLPPALFDATQHPEGFSGSEVGAAYRSSDAAAKVTQVRADSLTFDFSP